MCGLAAHWRDRFQLPNTHQGPPHLKRHQADDIADRAVAYLAADPSLLDNFLSASGLSPDELLACAEDNAIRVQALHFLAGDEATAKAFSESVSLKPGGLQSALAFLDPHGSSAW
jgi:hypothetical protein